MNNQTAPALSRDEAISKLRDLMKETDIAMLTTVDAETGAMRSRPMGLQEAEFDGELWFFTFDTTAKVKEIDREHQVNVSFANKGKQTYVSVSGTAEQVNDKSKMKELWSPVLKVWFPEGLETPGLTLLRVDVDQAEYWESDGRIASVLSMAKALVTGEEYEGGRNEKVTL